MKRIHRVLVVLLVIAVLGASLRLRADDDADRAAFLQQRREQLTRKWEAQFRAADTNNDRELTLDEMRAAKMPDSLIKHFDEIDTDHDGGLSPEELIAAYDKRLARQQPTAAASAATP